MRIAKRCSEATTAAECYLMTASDIDNKQCVIYNGKCTGQYNSCRKNICEAIKLKDEYTSKKCVYKSEATYKCDEEQILCSYF